MDGTYNEDKLIWNTTDMPMPNFIVIGANKAGTTSLYHYLSQHPQIYMSPVKEPTFFSLEDQAPDKNRPEYKIGEKGGAVRRSLEQYMALFDGVTDEIAVGEASTGYMHKYEHAANRIKYHIPDAKLIAILRDPAERAYSNYLMYRREGLEHVVDFNQVIRGKGCTTIYVDLGFYYRQLEVYMELFARERIRIFLYEDLKANPVDLLQDIFRFLNVDDSFIPDVSEKHNVGISLVKSKLLHSFISSSEQIISNSKRFSPAWLEWRLQRTLNTLQELKKRNLVKSKITPESRKYLINIYKEDILRLQYLIQRDLSAWLEN